MEHMETKEIHNYGIETSDKIKNQYNKQSLKYKL
jgi:hypothetical protein